MADAKPESLPAREPRVPLEAGHVSIHIPVRFQRRSGRKEIVFQTVRQAKLATEAPAPRALSIALARGHRWLELLQTGRFASVAELADDVGSDPSFVRRMLSLTLINQVFTSMESEGVSLEALIRGISVIWSEQPK